MTPTNYILSLIRSFPCLRHKVTINTCTTQEDTTHCKDDGQTARLTELQFDADRFMRCFDTASKGERLCALFIVNVWNPAYAKNSGWSFDVIAFFGTADSQNRKAFLDWAQSPCFP